MKQFILSALALSIVVTIALTSSCKKDDNPTCAAGAGGNVEIVVYAAHNGTKLINSLQHQDTAYVKYGSTTSPGTSPGSYDTYYVSEAGEDHIHLTNLTCGSYYIYRTAHDTVANVRYTGGLGLSFTQSSGEVDTVINVN